MSSTKLDLKMLPDVLWLDLLIVYTGGTQYLEDNSLNEKNSKILNQVPMKMNLFCFKVLERDIEMFVVHRQEQLLCDTNAESR